MDYLKIDDADLDALMTRIRDHLNVPVNTTQSIELKNNSNRDSEVKIHDFSNERIEAFLSEANIGRTIGLSLPPMYRMKGIKRKAASLFGKVFIRFANLITNDIRKFNNAVLNTLIAIKSILNEIYYSESEIKTKVLNLENENQVFDQKFDDHRAQFNNLLNRISDVESHLSKVERELTSDNIVKRIEKIENEISILVNEVSIQSMGLQKLTIHLNKLESDTENTINNNFDNVRKIQSDLVNHFNHIEKDVLQRLAEKANKNEILLQDAFQQILNLNSLYRTQKRLIRDSIKELAMDELHLLRATTNNNISEEYISDEFYSDFQDEFRGTREDIKQRLEIYLPFIRNINIVDNKVVDLACGRGEWLELLKENDIKAVGVDSNSLQVYKSRSYGLDVFEDDVISFLEHSDDDSVGVITGFHIIEHLPFGVLVKMFKECYRVVKPNGMIIFETPNPQNLIVGSSNFYIDPTHNNPLHPDVMKFLFEQIGFKNVEIVYANKMRYVENLLKPLASGSDSALWEKNIDILNELLYGYQDYSVIGWKI